ncbi:MAG: cysteine desulfurase, partial [Bacilli bacterium]|nr:cysteine desulfurase [Bacilli bacterium]
VVFTSGDTMSINLIAYGYGMKFLNKDDEVIISEAEHASNFIPWIKVCELTGAKLKFVPLSDTGRITPENLEKVISKKTKIVSLAHVGNVFGYVADVKELARVAHKYGAIMVVDGAQSVPHLKTDFKDLDIDFLAFSAHKMCGPTGVGALIGKYDLLLKMDSFFTGGGMNITFNTLCNVEPSLPPAKFEAGTLNLAGILGFGKCIDFLDEIGIDNIHNHERELINYVVEKLSKNENVIMYNKDSDCGIFTFNIKNVFAQDEATLLNSKGIAVRSGLHCAKALVDFLKTSATVRMSVYLYTSIEEVDAFINAINEGGDILDAYFLN